MNLSRLKTYHDTTCAGALRFMEDISQTMQFDRNEALLDIGCGSGSLTTLLSKRVGRVTALDVSPVMIDAAEKNNRAENITYRVADATKLTTFREYRDKFDKVVAYFVLQWMNDAKEALKGIHQSLKPGGQCFVNTTQHNPDVFDTVNALGTYTDSKWSTFMEGYEYAYYPFHGNADDYKQILAGIGFKDIDCTQKVFKYPFKYDEAREFYPSFMGQLVRFPEDRREEYAEEAVNYVLDAGDKGGDEYLWTVSVITAVATKY